MVTSLALLGAMSAAGCGARDTGEFEFDPMAGSAGTGAGGFGGGGSGGFSGTGASGGFGGGVAGGAAFGGVAGSAAFGGVSGAGASGGVGAFGGVAGAAASGGIGGVAGGGMGGVGGIPGTEDCTNGVDDNGNGLVDCEDPECTVGFACTAPVPTGWAGPVAFYSGSAAPPSCSGSGGFPTLAADGGNGVSASPAICSACSCSTAQGVVCPVAQITLFSNSTCNGTGGTLTLPADVCQSYVSLSEIRSIRWTSSNPAGGSCNPGAPSPPVLPEPVWAQRGRACGGATQGGGCGGGACVARPSAPFKALACIGRVGDHTCPAGFPTKSQFSAGVNDTRDCSGCTCGAPSGASCSGSLTLGSNATCSADVATLNAPGQCASVGPDPSPPTPPYLESRSARYNQGPASTATCAPGGGQPTGGVTAGTTVTICCP